MAELYRPEIQSQEKAKYKGRFLGKMNHITSWKIVMKPIRKHYFKAGV